MRQKLGRRDGLSLNRPERFSLYASFIESLISCNARSGVLLWAIHLVLCEPQYPGCSTPGPEVERLDQRPLKTLPVLIQGMFEAFVAVDQSGALIPCPNGCSGLRVDITSRAFSRSQCNPLWQVVHSGCHEFERCRCSASAIERAWELTGRLRAPNEGGGGNRSGLSQPPAPAHDKGRAISSNLGEAIDNGPGPRREKVGREFVSDTV